jgi:uncharacterized membrane protein
MGPVKRALKYVLALFFIAAGANHFRDPDFYVRIMPPYLPWHLALVYVSGACELILGILLLVPRARVLSAWGLIALLIAVFPANLHMALNTDLYPNIPPAVLWVRLPFQGLLIAWAYWFTFPERRPEGSSP